MPAPIGRERPTARNFGMRITGEGRFEDYNIKAHIQRNNLFSFTGSLFRTLKDKWGKVIDTYHMVVNPKYALAAEMRGLWGNEITNEYIAELFGHKYRSTGLIEVNVDKLVDWVNVVDRKMRDGILTPEEVFNHLTNPKGDLDAIFKDGTHKLHEVESLRRFAIDIGNMAVNLGLMKLGQYANLVGKYFPLLSFEILSDTSNPYALIWAVRNMKLIYDRFRSRLKEAGYKDEILDKYPHLIFTYAMMQEVYDVFTAKFMYDLEMVDRSFGSLNIAKDARITLPNGQEVMLPIAVNIRDGLKDLISKSREIKDRILKDLRKSGASKEVIEAKEKELDEAIATYRGQYEIIDRQIKRYSYILTLLNELVANKIDANKFMELAENPNPEYIGLKVKEGVDYSYLKFDAQYYLKDPSRWVLIESPSLNLIRGRSPIKLARVPAVSEYHIFSGVLVSKTLHNMIAEYYEFASPNFGLELANALKDWAVKLTNLHKFSNVALSPKSWMKNVLGNFTFYFLAGVPVHKIGEYFYRGLLTIMDEASYKELKKYGIASGSFSVEYIRPHLNEIANRIRMEMARGIKKAQYIPEILFDYLYEKTREIGVGSIYEMIDVIARAGLLHYFNDYNVLGSKFMEVGKDYSVRVIDENVMGKAMSKAYDYTIDYGNVTPLVKKIRSGIGGLTVTPYITFMLHAPYVFANAFRENPVRAFALLTLPIAMYIGGWLSVMKDEEGKELYKVASDSFKNFKTLVLPFKDEKGRYYFLSFAGWHPLDNWFDFATNMVRGKFTRALIESGFIYSSPLSGLMAQIFLGVDPFTGEKVITEIEKAMPDKYLFKVLALLADSFLPSFLKSYGDMNKFYKGMDKTRVLLSTIGINTHKRSVEDFLNVKKAEYLKQLIEVGKAKGQLQRQLQRGDIDEEYFEEEYKRLIDLEVKIRENIAKFYDEYHQILGGDNDEAIY